MKITIIVAILMLASAGTAFAGVKLIKGQEVAQVGIGTETITVSKFNDGTTTCYISRHGKFGSHAISCVK